MLYSHSFIIYAAMHTIAWQFYYNITLHSKISHFDEGHGYTICLWVFLAFSIIDWLYYCLYDRDFPLLGDDRLLFPFGPWWHYRVRIMRLSLCTRVVNEDDGIVRLISFSRLYYRTVKADRFPRQDFISKFPLTWNASSRERMLVISPFIGCLILLPWWFCSHHHFASTRISLAGSRVSFDEWNYRAA